MQRLRRFARWSAGALAALLLLGVAGAIVIETDWFRNWLRLRLVHGVSSVLAGELRVGKLGGSLWTGVTMDDVELWDARGRVFKADHVRVRYDPWNLAHRRWIVDSVAIDHAEVLVAQAGDRSWNVMHLTKPRRQSGGTATVTIHRIDLGDSTVTIQPASGESRTLTSVSLAASLTVREGMLSMDVASLRAHDAVTGFTLRELSGAARDNFRSFNTTFRADSPTSAVTGVANGEMSGGSTILNTTLDAAHVNLAQLTEQTRYASDITGKAQLRVTFPGAGLPARVNFTFSGPRSTAFGYTADRIDATGDFTGDLVRFHSRVAGYDARATVDGTLRLAGAHGPATFTGGGTFASVDLRRLPASLKVPPLESRVSGRFDTSVDAQGWRGHAIVSEGVVEGAAISRGAEGRLAAVSGVITYSATGAMQHVNLQRFGRTVPVEALTAPRFVSDLNGRFSVEGENRPNADPVVSGRGVVENSTISGTRVTSMNGTVHLEHRRLMVEATGVFDGLNDTTLGLPPASAPTKASGSVTGWFAIADIDRPIDENNLEGTVNLQLGASEIHGVPIEKALIDGALGNGALTLQRAEITHAGAWLQASGALGLREPVASGGMTIKGDVHDVAFLEKMLQRPLHGAGTIDATITGTVESPSATGTLTMHELAYANTVSALTMTTRFSVDWPLRDMEQLAWKIDTDATFVTIDGTNLQTVKGSAAGGLREMAVDVQADQRDRSLGIEGRLTLKPDAQLLLLRRLTLTTGDISWTLPAGQTSTIQYGNQHIEVSDLSLLRATQRIQIAGGFDLQQPADGRRADGQRQALDVTLQDVELADINRILLGTRQLTGRINGAVTVMGSREAPVLNGDIAIRDGMVEGVPYVLAQAKGTYAGGIAKIDGRLEQGPGASLAVTGTVPIAVKDGNKSMDVRVTGGPVNLGLVQAFTTEINNVRGDATLDLRVTGSVAEPLVNGTAILAAGAFDVPATGAQYHAIEAAFAFVNGQLAIKNLQVLDNHGDMLTAAGGIDVRRGVAERLLNVTVRARSFSVLANTFGTAEVDVDLDVTGSLGAPVVRGSARLEAGRLEVARILERTTATPYSTEAQAAPGAKPAAASPASPFDRADVSLQLRLPDNLVLRGRDLRISTGGFGIGDMNIITGGTFDLTKPPGAPFDVRGLLTIIQGSYSFQGRRFDIERGSDVRFRGSPISDPLLNVNATREVSGVTAEIRLRGSARSPELTLTSRPPLDEGDILSLIVFNQPVSSLGAAQQMDLGARAASLAAGAITSPLADSIGRALNLDVFEIQAPTSDDGTGSVSIGSQLGSRVLVGLKQQFGHSEASLVTLEYRVNRLLRFVTSVATGTLQAHATRRTDRGGVDLIFVIRY